MGALKYVSVAVVVLAYALYASQKPLAPAYYDLVPSGIRVVMRIMPYMDWPFYFLEKLGIASELNFWRGAMDSLYMEVPETDALRVENTLFDGVPVRLFIPRDRQPNGGALFYTHGGGWVLGSVNSHDQPTRALAMQLNMLVVSVEYRLAPESAYPAAIDDAEKAYRYLLSHAAEYNIDPSRVAVSGDSAGGNLAASLTVRMRDAALKSPDDIKLLPKAQILLYPVTQSINYTTVSMLLNAHDLLLTRRGMRKFAIQYILGMDFYNSTLRSLTEKYIDQGCMRLKHPEIDTLFQSSSGDIRARILTDDDRKFLKSVQTESQYSEERELQKQKCTIEQATLNELHSRLEPMLNADFSPLMSPSFKNIPPTYIVSCGLDVLRDDSLLYIERLRDAGVFVEHVHKAGLFHGYFGYKVDVYSREVADFVKKNNFI